MNLFWLAIIAVGILSIALVFLDVGSSIMIHPVPPSTGWSIPETIVLGLCLFAIGIVILGGEVELFRRLAGYTRKWSSNK